MVEESMDTNSVVDEVLQSLDRFAREFIDRDVRLGGDRAEQFPEALIRRMISSDFGFHLILIPEVYGGCGGGSYEVYRFSERMARLELGIATSFLAISLGMDPLRVGGSEEQKQRWIGAIAEQGLIVAYGVTEPNAGSDLGSFTTRADREYDESAQLRGYRLSGIKQFITNGGVADLYTILAQTPDGPSFFVIERSTPGLSAGKAEEKHGIRMSNTSQVILDDVFVPADQLIGHVEGKGMSQAIEVFGYTRLMVAAFGLGGGEAALGRAVRYAGERKQFGKSLLEFQGYTHRLLLPHIISLEAARALIEETALRLDSGEKGLETEGAIAKYFATEAGNSAADAAIQALGGYGYTHAYEIEKIRRDVRITTIYEGTSEILLQTIGKDRWRLFLQSGGVFLEQLAKEGTELSRRGPGSGGRVLSECAGLLKDIFEHIRLQRLTRQQHVVFMMGDMISRFHTAMALCRREVERKQTSGNDIINGVSYVFACWTMREIHHQSVRCFVDYGSLTPAVSSLLQRPSALAGQTSSGQNIATMLDTMSSPLLELARTW